MDNEKNWYPKYPSIHVSKDNWYPCIQVSMYPWYPSIHWSKYPTIQKKSVSKISKYLDIRKKWYPLIPMCDWNQVSVSETKTKVQFWYQYQSRFFYQNFFFQFKRKNHVSHFWGDRSFYKLKKPTCSKLICKYLKFGNNFCFGAFLCGKNTPY